MGVKMTALGVVVGVGAIIAGSVGFYWGFIGNSPSNPPVATTTPTKVRPGPRGFMAPPVDWTVTRMFTAVEADDLGRVKRFLAKDTSLSRAREPKEGDTPLHEARSVAMAELLLDEGAELMALDTQYHAPPVRWAAAEQRKEVARFLVTRGATQDDVFFAVAMGDVAQVEDLVKKNPALLHALTEKGDVLGENLTALHVAALTGQAESALALIGAGADVGAKAGPMDAEPLENAAWSGSADVAAVLLDHGAKIDAPVGKTGHTALWYGAVTGRKDIVKLLLARGATVESGLMEAVLAAKKKAYAARQLTPREDYDAVVELLRKQAKP